MTKPKYDDAETKKPGSPIETPFKYGDHRNGTNKNIEDKDKDKMENNNG